MEHKNLSNGRHRVWLIMAIVGLAGCQQSSSSGSFGKGASSLQGDDDAGVCVPKAAPTLTAKSTQLWPPNHKFHSIGVNDCVTAVDACGTPITGEFIWGSSDEPVDSLGDGHFAPDIVFGSCNQVDVRAERQGPKNGRVYKLGVRVVDKNGNAAESECTIIVDHDQRGVQGEDSGESYRIVLDGTGGNLSCDGVLPSDAGAPVAPPGTQTDGGAPSSGSQGGAPAPMPQAGSDAPPTVIWDAGSPS